MSCEVSTHKITVKLVIIMIIFDIILIRLKSIVRNVYLNSIIVMIMKWILVRREHDHCWYSVLQGESTTVAEKVSSPSWDRELEVMENGGGESLKAE